VRVVCMCAIASQLLSLQGLPLSLSNILASNILLIVQNCFVFVFESSAGRRSDPSLDRARAQVGEVMDVMRDNFTKVLDRGDKLGDLEDKSGRSTPSFSSCAGCFLRPCYSFMAAFLRKRLAWRVCVKRHELNGKGGSVGWQLIIASALCGVGLVAR
jgi:hypothetical protein